MLLENLLAWYVVAKAFGVGKSQHQPVNDWFSDLPPNREVQIPGSAYAVTLNNYREVAHRLVGWRKLEPQPETVDLTPLMARMGSTEFLFGKPLIARYDGKQAYQFRDPLECVRVKRTIDGVVSALFLVGELPRLSAWDHGLYDRDFELVITDSELSDALAEIGRDDTVAIPAGLRVRREGMTLIGQCLMYSFTEGLVHLSIQIGPDGSAAKQVIKPVLAPLGMRFY
jgi:hypothetical protein